MPTPSKMHHPIRSGSIEYILVTVGDHLENVASLSLLNPTFSVYDENDDLMITNQVANTDIDQPMVALCLIDTTTSGGWTSGKYRLELKLQAAPETPILAPVEFMVEVR